MKFATVLGVVLLIKIASFTQTDYSWTRGTDSGASIMEFGSSIDTGPRIFVRSGDSELFKEGFKPARTIIDFSDDANTVAVIYMNRACFVIPTPSGNFTDAVNELEAREAGTVSAADSAILINATSDTLMTYAERDAFFTANPIFLKICSWVPIYNYNEADAGTFPTTAQLEKCQKLVNGWSYNSAVSVLLTRSYCYGHHGHYRHYGRFGYYG